MHPAIEKIRFYIYAVLAIAKAPFVREKARGKRILIIPQLTRIGDLICTTPVFAAIKKAYPESYLAVVVAEYAHTADIIRDNPHIDEIIELTNREYLSFLGLSSFFKRIREKHFDWSINLAGSTLGTLVGVFGEIPERIKITRRPRPITEILTDWLNKHQVRYRGTERIPVFYLQALEALSVPVPEKIIKEQYVSKEGEAKAEAFWQANDLQNKSVVGIAVKAGEEIKEWGMENFAELGKQLLAAYKGKIILIGAPRDRSILEEVGQALNGRALIAADFSLRELPSLLKRLSLFVSADTGPMHMAHALGTPLVDIIGPVDPKEQAPIEDTRAIVVVPPEVAPSIFALKAAGDPAESRRAVESTTVAVVFNACKQLLARTYGI